MKRATNPRLTPITFKAARHEAVALKLIAKKRRVTRSSLIREYIVRGLQEEAA